MIVKINMNLPIYAFPKNDHYVLPKEKIEVDEISMGQSHTNIKLKGHEWVYNSVHFDFYLGNRKIDIYKSGLINNYMTLYLPGISFLED